MRALTWSNLVALMIWCGPGCVGHGLPEVGSGKHLWVGPLEGVISINDGQGASMQELEDGHYVSVTRNKSGSTTFRSILIDDGVERIEKLHPNVRGGLVVIRGTSNRPRFLLKFYINGLQSSVSRRLYQSTESACYAWGLPAGVYEIQKFDASMPAEGNPAIDIREHWFPTLTFRVTLEESSIYVLDFRDMNRE